MRLCVHQMLLEVVCNSAHLKTGTYCVVCASLVHKALRELCKHASNDHLQLVHRPYLGVKEELGIQSCWQYIYSYKVEAI